MLLRCYTPLIRCHWNRYQVPDPISDGSASSIAALSLDKGSCFRLFDTTGVEQDCIVSLVDFSGDTLVTLMELGVSIVCMYTQV